MIIFPTAVIVDRIRRGRWESEQTERKASAPQTFEQNSCHTAEAAAGRQPTPLLLENRRSLRRGTAAIQNPAVLAISRITNTPAW